MLAEPAETRQLDIAWRVQFHSHLQLGEDRVLRGDGGDTGSGNASSEQTGAESKAAGGGRCGHGCGAEMSKAVMRVVQSTTEARQSPINQNHNRKNSQTADASDDAGSLARKTGVHKCHCGCLRAEA